MDTLDARRLHGVSGHLSTRDVSSRRGRHSWLNAIRPPRRRFLSGCVTKAKTRTSSAFTATGPSACKQAQQMWQHRSREQDASRRAGIVTTSTRNSIFKSSLIRCNGNTHVARQASRSFQAKQVRVAALPGHSILLEMAPTTRCRDLRG